MSEQQGQIVELTEFTSDAKGLADYWQTELEAYFKASEKWHKTGSKTVDRFRDERTGGDLRQFRLNLFYANITTVTAMLFGKLPEITMDRRNNDYNDDVARVASIIMQRCLQNDIGKPNDQYSTSLKKNLQDRLIPGMGASRTRYDFDEETTEVAAQFDMEGNTVVAAYQDTKVTDERAPIEYIHWRDIAWSPARTWDEVRWVAFREYLTRGELIKRFGKEVGEAIPLTENTPRQDKEDLDNTHEKQDAWKRAAVWEIWDKTDEKVFWYAKDCPKILDQKEDPLNLTGFFPIPRPMTANVTTTAYMPIPDYMMSQDLYNEVDVLETRITLITQAVKVVGVYDKSSTGVKRMLTEGVENDLLPVDNWAMFAEKGGLQGQIDWLPIDSIASVLEKLIMRRNDVKAQLFEVTGMSDIMRGAQAAGGAVSATERALEARFASVRIQALQDEFATYATDLIRLRAEIISKHFSPESIVMQSNILSTADGQDPQLIQAAVELIKNTPDFIWRVQVKPESVSMVDYAALKQERTDYLNGVATFLQSSAPLIEKAPQSAPVLMELLKWGLAGFKGGAEIEGVLDKALDQMSQQPEQGQEEQDPAAAAEAAKAQAEQAKMQMQMQADQAKIQGQLQLETQKHQQRLEQIQAEAQARAQELNLEAQQDAAKEQAQLLANMREEEFETEQFQIREAFRASLKPTESDTEDD